jgi:small subunit ribosomal protein S4e
MTRHQKRLSAPASWPIERKTSVYTVKAGAGPHGSKGVPLLVIIRDVLQYVTSAKEANYALRSRSILINGKVITDPRRSIGMFDILAFLDRNEYYRIFPDSGGRLNLTPISSEAATSKLGKITGKVQLSPTSIQLSLHNGTTLIVPNPTEYYIGDSLITENETGNIVAHFSYKEGALVTVIGGSHSGEIGVLETISVRSGSASNVVQIKTNSSAFDTIEKYVVVIDEKFVEGGN